MTIKYNNNLESREFFKEVKKRVSEHFAKTKSTPYANFEMWMKIICVLALWLVSYLCIISDYFPTYMLIIFVFIHGLTHLLIPFNISHDANHNSLSRYKIINDIFSYSMALIGVSSFFWKIGHNQEHHTYINVKDMDNNINGYGILKFSPEDEHKGYYRFQHLYATFIYGFVTINYVFSKDFKMLKALVKSGAKIPMRAIIELILVKLFYVTYIFIIPYYCLNVSFISIVVAFVLVQFMLGIILSYVFQCGHFTEDAHYPNIVEESIQDGWAAHTLKASCDYASDSSVITQLAGGINIHIPHHLFPTVCHIHYKSLVPIIKKTAQEYGLPYREYKTFSNAIASHFKLLKRLGS